MPHFTTNKCQTTYFRRLGIPNQFINKNAKHVNTDHNSICQIQEYISGNDECHVQKGYRATQKQSNA